MYDVPYMYETNGTGTKYCVGTNKLYDSSHSDCTSIGVDFGGQPGHGPLPIIQKHPCISHFLPPFAPPIFWFAHPIFLTSLRQCVLVYNSLLSILGAVTAVRHWFVGCVSISTSKWQYLAQWFC